MKQRVFVIRLRPTKNGDVYEAMLWLEGQPFDEGSRKCLHRGLGTAMQSRAVSGLEETPLASLCNDIKSNAILFSCEADRHLSSHVRPQLVAQEWVCRGIVTCMVPAPKSIDAHLRTASSGTRARGKIRRLQN